MNTREEILKYIQSKKEINGHQLVSHFNISRQALNKHIKFLIEKEKIIKNGTTRNAIYLPFIKSSKKIFTKKYSVSGLEEDKIFQEASMYLKLKSSLKSNTYQIVQYAFTEMLNNVIDHSQSDHCLVIFTFTNYQCDIIIRDYGIGLFYSIFSKYELQNEEESIGELLKGKTTTMKSRHSGEGIFFTSKIVNSVSYGSHKIKLIFDNKIDDVFIESQNMTKGTEVHLIISNHTRHTLDNLFQVYAPKEFDFRFEKTKILVKFFQQEYISRSEARRLLNGLDKFKEIILDFKNVTRIGQGFTDEVFRIFKKNNPGIVIKTSNLKPELKQMILHVVDNNN